MCKANLQQVRWFCHSFDSSAIDATQNTMSTSVNLCAQKSKFAKDRKTMNFFPLSSSKDFGFDRGLFWKFNSANVGTGNNECNKN